MIILDIPGGHIDLVEVLRGLDNDTFVEVMSKVLSEQRLLKLLAPLMHSLPGPTEDAGAVDRLQDSNVSRDARSSANVDQGDRAVDEDHLSKLFVVRVAEWLPFGQFKRFFEQFGHIKDAIVMPDRGFGIVTYNSPAPVKKAIEAANRDRKYPGWLEVNKAWVEVKQWHPSQDRGIRVDYLSADVTREHVHAAFEHYGPVESIDLLPGGATKPRQYAYVQFKEQGAVRRVMRQRSSLQIPGDRVHVVEMIQKRDDAKYVKGGYGKETGYKKNDSNGWSGSSEHWGKYGTKNQGASSATSSWDLDQKSKAEKAERARLRKLESESRKDKSSDGSRSLELAVHTPASAGDVTASAISNTSAQPGLSSREQAVHAPASAGDVLITSSTYIASAVSRTSGQSGLPSAESVAIPAAPPRNLFVVLGDFDGTAYGPDEDYLSVLTGDIVVRDLTQDEDQGYCYGHVLDSDPVRKGWYPANHVKPK